MSEHFGECPHVHAVLERQGRECMSHVMKSHMLRTDFFDDPVVQPAESIRVPRFTRARRWEQIRIRRVFFMLLYKKLYCICWEQHRSDGIWRFGRADNQFSVLPCDAFINRQRAVLNVQVIPP